LAIRFSYCLTRAKECGDEFPCVHCKRGLIEEYSCEAVYAGVIVGHRNVENHEEVNLAGQFYFKPGADYSLTIPIAQVIS
jgi:hypothetical protein